MMARNDLEDFYEAMLDEYKSKYEKILREYTDEIKTWANRAVDRGGAPTLKPRETLRKETIIGVHGRIHGQGAVYMYVRRLRQKFTA